MPASLYHGSPLMVDHTPVSAVSAGDVVAIGDELRICHTDIPANRKGALAAPGGDAVYLVDKATGAALGDGVPAFWNPTNKNVQATDAAGTLKRLGFTVGATASGDTQCYVRHISAKQTA